jgi:agmatinase
MRFDYLLSVLPLAGLTLACNHHHDDKKWTAEELAELEAKWGFDVWPFFSHSPKNLD